MTSGNSGEKRERETVRDAVEPPVSLASMLQRWESLGMGSATVDQSSNVEVDYKNTNKARSCSGNKMLAMWAIKF